jgi:hypothetical protein
MMTSVGIFSFREDFQLKLSAAANFLLYRDDNDRRRVASTADIQRRLPCGQSRCIHRFAETSRPARQSGRKPTNHVMSD